MKRGTTPCVLLFVSLFVVSTLLPLNRVALASGSYDLLIIGPKTYEHALQRFIQFKQSQGIDAHYASVEEITEGFQGSEKSLAIHDFVAEEFLRSGIRYLLLVGMYEDIPPKYVYCPSDDFGIAYAKSQIASGNTLPLSGKVFFGIKDSDKSRAVDVARKLHEMGFKIMATSGTAKFFNEKGLNVEKVLKVGEGRPNIVDLIKNRKIDLIINTPLGKASRFDENAIGRNAILKKIPFITTLSGASASVKGIKSMRREPIRVRALQEYHKEIMKINDAK
jgi:methylglyoxal synthase